jgi:flagellar biosynthesis/type III secretory pathway M-ring protein FliF/YscJ
VSVLDDTGKLLSQSPDTASGSAVDAQQLLYVQQMEQQYTRRIMDILEPVVGRNNVKAQVSAEVDFSQTESTSEQHRPNQTPGCQRDPQPAGAGKQWSPGWRAAHRRARRRGQPAARTVCRAHQRRQSAAGRCGTASHRAHWVRGASASPPSITKWTRPCA